MYRNATARGILHRWGEDARRMWGASSSQLKIPICTKCPRRLRRQKYFELHDLFTYCILICHREREWKSRVPGSLGRHAKEKLLLATQFKRLGCPARSGAGRDGRGAHHADHRLAHAEDLPKLPRTRRKLSGADRQRSAPAVFREMVTETRAEGHGSNRTPSSLRIIFEGESNG